MNRPTYKPGVFDVTGQAEARSMIVTQLDGMTTDQRWETETKFLVEDIAEKLALGPQSCVLDYGCGIGRISKGLIEKTGCHAVGVDMSKSMLLLAPDYVLSDRFVAWSQQTYAKMIAKGFHFDAAISIWVIQHVLNAEETIRQIHSSLKTGAGFYALNQRLRCVPTDMGWINDGFDIRLGLWKCFAEEKFYKLPESAGTPLLGQESMVQILRKAGELDPVTGRR